MSCASKNKYRNNHNFITVNIIQLCSELPNANMIGFKYTYNV